MKLRRTVEHMNQEQFADKLGISRRQLCRIEKHRGNNRISPGLEKQYKEFYGEERLVDKLKGGK